MSKQSPVGEQPDEDEEIDHKVVLQNICEGALLLLRLQRETDEEINLLIEGYNKLLAKQKAQIAAWEKELCPYPTKQGLIQRALLWLCCFKSPYRPRGRKRSVRKIE